MTIDDTYLEFGESEGNPVACGSLAAHPRHEFYSHQYGTDVVCPGRERETSGQPLGVPCPNCQARVGEACTIAMATGTSRVPVLFFHLARKAAAGRRFAQR